MLSRSKHFLSHKSLSFVTLLVVLSLILAACQPQPTPAPAATNPPPTAEPTAVPTTAPTAVPTAAPSPTVEAVVEPTIAAVSDAKFGQILVDAKGMTLYMFTKDGADQSNCNAACLAKWPPVITAGSPKAGDGVDAAKLGSTKLADGRLIVTYNHMPLYYWVADKKPGDMSGQNVGSVWYVVNTAGDPVKAELTSASSAASSSAAEAQVEEPEIKVVSDAKYGKILVDGKGMTLYIFTKDAPDQSNCNAGCLAKWPPLITAGSPKADDGVDASKLGTAKLADGRLIVTYNHMPLYYWVNDTKPGDTTGQNVGSVWFVVNPDGKSVQASAPSSGY